MKKFIIILALGIAIAGCSKTKSDKPATEFDQAKMLGNYADQVIVPSYQHLADEAGKLVEAATAFSSNPDEAELGALQTQFESAYKAWVHCEPYDFGPAADLVMLNDAINYWPAKPSLINAELAASGELTNDYVDALGAEKKGFPVLGYLLYDIDNGNAAIVDSFTNASDAERRKQYIVSVAGNIASNVNKVLEEWKTGYAGTFKNGTGTSLNSSISLLLNSLVISLETSKNKRIGIPIGRKDNFSEGPVSPAALELPYSPLAKQMLRENALTLGDLFTGNHNGTSGIGFDDFVAAVSDSGASLASSINTELATYQSDIDAIASPMQTSVGSNPDPIQAVWVQNKKLIVLLKVDLASNLGVLITFSDNDGD
jgi:uncharacterized protein